MVPLKRTQNLQIAYSFMVLHLHILTTKVLNSRFLPVLNAFFCYSRNQWHIKKVYWHGSNAGKYRAFQGVWTENVALKWVVSITSKGTCYSFATCVTNVASHKS